MSNAPKYRPLPPMPDKTGLLPQFGAASAGWEYAAFNHYCHSFPDASAVCNPRSTPPAAYETMTPKLWAALNKVNDDVNGSQGGDPKYKIVYPDPTPKRDPFTKKPVLDPITKKPVMLTDDGVIYGEDRFVNPLSPLHKGPRTKDGFPLGDCDDFTLAKQAVLIKEHGIKPENLRFAYIASKGHGPLDHAALLVLTDRGIFVLDNGVDTTIKRLEETDYHYTSVQDHADPRTFVEIKLSGAIDFQTKGENSIYKTFDNSRSSRMRHSHFNVPKPTGVSYSQSGWHCRATAGFKHNHIDIDGKLSSTIASIDGSILSGPRIEVERHYDLANNPIREHYRAYGPGDTVAAELSYKTEGDEVKQLAATRHNNPQIRTILDTLRATGINCTPERNTMPTPLPPLTQLKSLTDKVVEPPVRR